MIRTEGLTKRFGPETALDRLDLDVRGGELFCFLGPNGAGKTTTIKLLTGLLRPTAGRAWIGGYDVQRQPLEAKRLLGYVPDHPYLYDKLTGREMLRFVGGLYRLAEREAAARSERLLEELELRPVAERLVGDMSHGMRQRLAFACCFLPAPQVVVVDEPWVGLDPRHIRRVKRYLQARTRDGLTVFMSTHTLSIAEEMGDRVGILHRGRLLHVGTVDEVKALAERPGTLEDVFLQLTREAPEPVG